MTTIEEQTIDQIPMQPGNAFLPNDYIPRDDGSLLPGPLSLANESRFNSSFFSQPLTTYAVGWRDPNNVEKTLHFLTPPIRVGRRFEFKQTDNSEAFLSELDDTRALGADFKRVEYKGSTVVDKTHNRGLTMRIDVDSVEAL